ncbi:cofactor assembly of complex C [Rhynchospora pubera]|uniref:Cofactor assembly of complex C n=1 Tax=Rhynchospora pubera TaxID=906938 RepID=A0AAV8D3C7_9POAL|nr:cofactor assembly of complex C [Rhynchospora pubera]
MEASSLLLPRLRPTPTAPPAPYQYHYHPRFHLHLSSVRSSPVARASSNSSQGTYRGAKPQRDWIGEWVSKNDGLVRILPISVGGVSLVAVLLNRAFSGIAPVADASSSQSRADILTLSLAVTDILAGLVWLSIRPKYISPVAPSGIECKWVKPGISIDVNRELLWFWESLSSATRCKSLVVVYGNDCLLQIGAAAESPEGDGGIVAVDVNKLTQGSLCRSCMQSSKHMNYFFIFKKNRKKKTNPTASCTSPDYSVINILALCCYLANLSLYPGRTELPFLPNNTQALILQPIGDKGVAIIGGDTIRGFTAADQAWISMVAEKLDGTVSKFAEAFCRS